jgi:hypothetical protein
MVAIVKIDLSRKPDREKEADMRGAAREFSDDNRSIRVRRYEYNDIYRLETRFSMKTVAQYKVVDRIFHEFEFASDSYDDFLDISVSFAK